MKNFNATLKVLACAVFILTLSSVAQAQATRTWVSGVGDDVNPCSRTAPCKTFAGAISKTFINGEINVIDPGGFGTITITKSMTIDGTGPHASILASGAPAGVTVNIAVNANDPHRRVTLRNLSINGTGASGGVGTNTGTRGIRATSNGMSQLYVEGVNIQNFSTNGISVDFTPAAAGARVFVKDTTVSNITGGTTPSGIDFNAGGSFLTAMLDNVNVGGTATGLNVRNNSFVAFRNSTVHNCTTAGAAMVGPTGTMSLEHSYIFSTNVGVAAGAAGTVTDLSNTTIQGNSTGITGGASAGTLISHGNNQIFNNAAPGTAPTVVGPQ